MNSFHEYLSHEIYVNVFVQKHFKFFEPLFEAATVYLGPTWIMNYIMPIVFSHNMYLSTRALFIMSMLDLIASVIKWTCGMDRPYWWVRENNGPLIRQHQLTCETTSGFPSSHSIICTGFIYVTTLSILPPLQRQFRNHSIMVRYITYLLMCSLITFMWLDRLYFACHFFHQCLLGTAISLAFIALMQHTKLERKLFNMDKLSLILMIMSIAIVAVAFYYKQVNEGIEMRSVRMAFKWCDKPEYLKHENSPVYWLGRSFGFALGVALSAPLRERFNIELIPHLSVPVTAVLIGLCSALDIYTPKNYGRVAFVGYGIGRSFFLSYALLNVVPYFCGIKKQ